MKTRKNISKIEFSRLLNYLRSLGMSTEAIRENLLAKAYFNVTKNRQQGTATVVFDNKVIEY